MRDLCREKKRTNLINCFESGIIFECFEGCPVTFPKKFQPGSYKGPICPIFTLIPADCTQQDTFGGLAGLKIVDIHCALDGSFLLGLFYFCICKLNKACNDELYTLHACVLSNILVLHQTFLGRPALAQVDAEFDKPVHDGFKRSQGCRPESFRGEHFC